MSDSPSVPTDQPVVSDQASAPIDLQQLLEESGSFQYTTHHEIDPVIPLVIVAILILMGLKIVTNLAQGKNLFSGFDGERPRPGLDKFFRGDGRGPIGWRGDD